MLYFYCCDVRMQGQLIANIDGVYACNKKIEEPEEFKQTRWLINKETIDRISKQQPGMSIDNMQVILTAFNPL